MASFSVEIFQAPIWQGLGQGWFTGGQTFYVLHGDEQWIPTGWPRATGIFESPAAPDSSSFSLLNVAAI